MASARGLYRRFLEGGCVAPKEEKPRVWVMRASSSGSVSGGVKSDMMRSL